MAPRDGSGEAATDLDYASASALTLNGGTIQEANGLPANLALPAPGTAGSLGANKNIAVDSVSPTIVAISVDLYHCLHEVVEEDLRDRALLLIGGFGDAAAACDALTKAAVHCPRPHVLLTFRSTRFTATAAGTDVVVREARSVYGSARPTSFDPHLAPDGSPRHRLAPRRPA